MSNVVQLPSRAIPDAPAQGIVRPVDALDAMVDSFRRFGVVSDRQSLAMTLIAGLDAGHLDEGSASTMRVVLTLMASDDRL
jgi:hypothetical protein